MALETATEFADRIINDPAAEWDIKPTIAAVEARDNAVRLALLDELEAGACVTPRCDCWRQVIVQVLRHLTTQERNHLEEGARHAAAALYDLECRGALTSPEKAWLEAERERKAKR